MNKLQCVKTNNFEVLGKNYLEKAVNFAIKKEFQKSYEFIKEGLDFLTCDCLRGSWYNNFENLEVEIFNDIENNTTNHNEYFFVKSFILSFSEDKMKLYSALDAIEKYLNVIVDEYGFFIKGRVFNALEEFEKSFESYSQALILSNNPRNKYRIGRLKEFKMEEFGIDDLYLSFIENPSSNCCAENLQNYFQKRKLSLNYSDEFSSNILLNYFENKSSLNFGIKYMITFNNQLQNSENTILINDFIKIINLNEEVFIPKKNIEIELDDDNDSYNSDEDSNYNSYGSGDDYYDDSLDMDQQSPEFWDNI